MTSKQPHEEFFSCDHCRFRYKCDLPSFDTPGGCGLYEYDMGAEFDLETARFDPAAFEGAMQLLQEASEMGDSEKLQQLLLIATEMKRGAIEGDHEFRKYVSNHARIISEIITCPSAVCDVCGEPIRRSEPRVPLIKSSFKAGKIHYTNIFNVHPECKRHQLAEYSTDDWMHNRYCLE